MAGKQQHQLVFLSQLLSYFAIGSLFFLAIGLKDIDNYIDWYWLSFTLLAAGFCFGWILYFLLAFFVPGARHFRNKKGLGFFAPLAFAFSLIFFGTGSMVNESSDDKLECKDYVIQDLGSGRRAYFIFIDNGSRKERLSFGRTFNNNHQAGDTINLCIMKGRLGFRYYKVNQAKSETSFSP